MRSPVDSKKSSFSPDEICRIIKSCKFAGVSSLELGNLKVRFASSVASEPNRRNKRTQAQEEAVVSQETAPPTNHETQAQEALEVDELHLKEERLAMLMLEDPQEFERQLAAGDLEEMVEDESEHDE